ncbi:serine-rich adhesin for platelets [Aplysia californica]|uniref:Serine-rich adhesin for platelets n=1 Tax=Aplysia californica TaxID=6500 RepID=A0ABM1VP19_APLCA|nr:serine-rich adhesin for platelets [Aplysia californica]XP_035824162.1 serine-rich adhesin for platelets [Aplysia californica]XP_035824163.1 serine-rich adhesin for platelets [Aplysia californica]
MMISFCFDLFHCFFYRTSHDSSRSLSSRSSTGKSDESTESLHSLRAKLEQESKRAQEEKYRSEGEVKYLRESLHKQEEELEKLRTQRDEILDEQKQVKSERERRLQQQLDSLTSQTQFKERELQEQNQSLQEKLRKLQQQQQSLLRSAADRSGSEISSSPRQASPRKVPVKPSPPSKAKQLKLLKGGSSESQGFPTTFSFMQQTKPTPQATSPASKAATTSISCQTDGSSTSQLPGSTVVAGEVQPAVQRRLRLNIPANCNRHEVVSGSQVVTQLLQSSGSCVESVDSDSEFDQWDPGLTGLLHAMSTSLTLAGLTYSRGREANFLSPIKPKKHDLLNKSSGSSRDGNVQVVSREHFRLAIGGLTMLLEESSGHREKLLDLIARDAQLGDPKPSSSYREKDMISEQKRDVNGNKSLERGGTGQDRDTVSSRPTDKKTPSFSHSSSVKDSKQSGHMAAVLLIPLLTDYIQHYLDLSLSAAHSRTASSAPAAATQSLAASKSFSVSLDSTRTAASFGSVGGSHDSSLDSLSSCVLQLLHEGKMYASSVESYALSALKTLLLLIRLCPSLGYMLVTSVGDQLRKRSSTSTVTTASSSSAHGASLSKKSTSGAEADDERSTSSSEVRVILGAYNVSQASFRSQVSAHSCDSRSDSALLMNLLLNIAGQDLQDNALSPAIVQQALKVLVQLCHCCESDSQLEKLEVILNQGILSTCLRQVQHFQVSLWAQRLLTGLSASRKLFQQLCTKSESCLLYLMHRLCLRRSSDHTEAEKISLYCEHLHSLSTIMYQHKDSCSLLLTNSCLCSEELVVSVIVAMDRLFSHYCDTERSATPPPHPRSLLRVLASGVTVIHTLVQADPLFAQHHARAQMQYVRTLTGLTAVFRADPKEWEQHLPALEELCDFEPDSGNLSQDGDGEDRMDQS